jgi:hypothetical protein
MDLSKDESGLFDIFPDFPTLKQKRKRHNRIFEDSNFQDHVITPVHSKDDNMRISTPLLSILRKSVENSPFALNLKKRNSISPFSTKLTGEKLLTGKRIKKKFDGGRSNFLTETRKSILGQKNVFRNDEEMDRYPRRNQQDMIMNANQVNYDRVKIDKNAEDQDEKKEGNFSCNCKHSQCLKLYCDCLRNNGFCGPRCNCNGCENHGESKKREARILAIKQKNPLAFKPIIIAKDEGRSHQIHHRGCNCKRNGCLKNYCECKQFGVLCGFHCKCVGCKNCIDQDQYNLKKQKQFSITSFQSILLQLKHN